MRLHLDKPCTFRPYVSPMKEHFTFWKQDSVILIIPIDIPGADRIAKQTGGKIVGNGEVMRVMREAGVPEDQLIGM